MQSVELFAGAGGLALGVSLAGFEPLAVVERDKWACDTIRENQKRGFPIVTGWPVWEGDVRHFDWSTMPENIDLIAGGPPCQPFSLGGRHKAHSDDRDMFPSTVDIIRRLRPKAFIVENVKGITRSNFTNYFQYIQLQLEYPEISPRRDEHWGDHLKRLQKEKTSGVSRSGLTYNLVVSLVNAADYGVPQKRERVFMVGFRNDLDIKWSLPNPTHSFSALLRSQWLTGEYWDRHCIRRSWKSSVPDRLAARVRKLASSSAEDESLAWRTVRDALVEIPHPKKSIKRIHNHKFQGGAKSYPGHTGSPLDLPAKTLKAGVHGVPGGENMMVQDNGRVRYFTVRESARLQCFPDGYIFHGSWTETMRQLGNAVPVSLARIIAASVAKQLAVNELVTMSNPKHSAAVYG